MSESLPALSLRVSEVIRLPRRDGFKPISYSVGLDGRAVRLFVPEDSVEGVFGTIRHGIGVFAKNRTEQEYSGIGVISGTDGSEEIHLSGLIATFPKIEILPNQEVLLVAPRCRQSNGVPEANARVYDRSGTLKREFVLGDGIAHVQADPRGNLWVGYFDEGVYGNFGWNAGDTFGAAGLSCFSGSGEKLWDFHPPEGFDFIDDCYALNVTQSDAWTYYYSAFPFVRIDSDFNVRGWETRSAGAKTFAVAEERILLYGGYLEKAGACKLFRIGDKKAELLAYISLVLPDEVELSKARVVGRGSEVHVFAGDDWFRFSMRNLD